MNLQAQQLAQRIVQCHASKLAGASLVAAATSDCSSDASTESLALELALPQLGFLPADVAIIKGAWMRQSTRLGRFQAELWPAEPIDFDLAVQTAAAIAFPPCPVRLGLYAILPDADWVAQMAQAGVPTLQLRFKSDDTQAIDRQVKAAIAAVKGSRSLLFINDHWASAIEHGAYGVHLGQEDLDLHASALERIRLAGLRLGVSTHGYAEMLRAVSLAPSYMAMGAIFPTTLKRMASAPQGLARLRVYAQLMAHLPLVAIGGIDRYNLAAVRACGVGSVAMVRAIIEHPKPTTAAQELMAAFDG